MRLAALGLVGACGSQDPVLGGASAEDSGVSDGGGVSVSGRVEDLDGMPVVDAFVTVSTEHCIPDRTDLEGAFAVHEVSPGRPRLITYGETASNGLFASVVFELEVDGTLRLSGPVLAPALVETHPVDPDADEVQEVSTAEGLDLSILPGSLSLAPFAPAEVQVARVPVDQAPPFVPEGVELVDLFVLHPVRSTLDPPAQASFPADSGLAPGSAVVFHALDYDTGWLVPVATGEVDTEGHPKTHEGEGLPELTWVGLSLEQP